MRKIEKEEEQISYDDPDKKVFHLCIVNLVIGWVPTASLFPCFLFLFLFSGSTRVKNFKIREFNPVNTQSPCVSTFSGQTDLLQGVDGWNELCGSYLKLCLSFRTLYCAKGNYDFGISRVIKSLEPYNKKVGHFMSCWDFSLQIVRSNHTEKVTPTPHNTDLYSLKERVVQQEVFSLT